MKILIMLSTLFIAGCATTPPMRLPSINPFKAEGEVAQADPMQSASFQMTRYGVILVSVGLVFGAFTRFQTGWGLSLAAAGFLMILLAWTFKQWWTPWLGLSTILAYVGYKVWNRLNPNVKTEPLLK